VGCVLDPRMCAWRQQWRDVYHGSYARGELVKNALPKVARAAPGARYCGGHLRGAACSLLCSVCMVY